LSPSRCWGNARAASAPSSLSLSLSLSLSQPPPNSKSKAAPFNTLYRGAVPNAANNTPPIQPNQPQFKGQAITGGGHQAISAIPLAPPTVLYPSQIYVVAGTSTPTGAAIVHVRASFGFGFATGAPRYLFGDFILPPNRDDAGAELAADSTYWRAEPVKPGETFVHVDGPQDSGPHIAANTTLNYYFSPHAERVLASQFGRVAITWVSRVPVASGADTRLRYRFPRRDLRRLRRRRETHPHDLLDRKKFQRPHRQRARRQHRGRESHLPRAVSRRGRGRI
jgi:hypothetical protein